MRGTARPGSLGTVTVSMPYWRTPATLRTAVTAVLAQTYRDLRLVVVNDGDRQTRPWELLADITDPRLLRVDLPANRGRYFCDAAVLQACDTPWFAVHDSDDEATPVWLEWLIRAAADNGWDACVAPQTVVSVDGVARLEPVGKLLPSRRLRHVAHHAAVYRTQALRDVAGPHPGFRIGYDTLLLNLLLMRHSVGEIDRPVYTRRIRPGSLTTSPDTGTGTQARRVARRELERLHSLAWQIGPYAAIRPTMEVETLAEVGSAADVIRARWEETPVTVLREPVWGEWALDACVAQELRHHLRATMPRYVAEFGSGMSTVLLAEYARDTGAAVTTYEHQPRYAAITRDNLEQRGLGGYVDLRLCEIGDVETSAGVLPWYRDDMPLVVDFALVDGPPGKIGRAAAMFALATRLKGGENGVWELWLDDADRPGEQAALDLWREHFLFIEVEQLGLPKGLARVFPRGAPGRPILDASDIAITLLTGDRPDLLARTLMSLRNGAPGLLSSAHVAVVQNGPDTPDATPEPGYSTDDILGMFHQYIDTFTLLRDRLPVGQATTALLGYPPPRPYTLHLEDDWQAVTADITWLDRARQVLTDHADIHQVRLRHAGETVMARHMLTRRPLMWQPGPYGTRTAPAHYTLNPSLMRSAEVAELWPADGENGAARQFYNRGWKVAQMEPGVFRHIGGGASLRLGERP